MPTTNKYDLTLLENLASSDDDTLHTLSPETTYLCLMALDDRAIYQGAWWDDGDNITAARWDQARAIVDKAKKELIEPSTVIDGGGP